MNTVRIIVNKLKMQVASCLKCKGIIHHELQLKYKQQASQLQQLEDWQG